MERRKEAEQPSSEQHGAVRMGGSWLGTVETIAMVLSEVTRHGKGRA